MIHPVETIYLAALVKVFKQHGPVAGNGGDAFARVFVNVEAAVVEPLAQRVVVPGFQRVGGHAFARQQFKRRLLLIQQRPGFGRIGDEGNAYEAARGRRVMQAPVCVFDPARFPGAGGQYEQQRGAVGLTFKRFIEAFAEHLMIGAVQRDEEAARRGDFDKFAQVVQPGGFVAEDDGDAVLARAHFHNLLCGERATARRAGARGAEGAGVVFGRHLARALQFGGDLIFVAQQHGDALAAQRVAIFSRAQNAEADHFI